VSFETPTLSALNNEERFAQEYSVLRESSRGRKHLELRKLIREERISREFHDEFSKLSASYFWLLLA
jgi:hypothetical protein